MNSSSPLKRLSDECTALLLAYSDLPIISNCPKFMPHCITMLLNCAFNLSAIFLKRKKYLAKADHIKTEIL
jgi:hypothetical protein